MIVERCFKWGWLLIMLSLVLIPPSVCLAHDGAVVLECDQPPGGGGNANLRGIQFEVSRNFASIEVPMIGSEPVYYTFTAELRRGQSFATPILAAVRVETNLSGQFQMVHIDFPEVQVSGPEYFSLRFVDFNPDIVAFTSSSAFNTFPCSQVLLTNDNNSNQPTPIASVLGLRVLGVPGGCTDCPGDLNGDLIVDMSDFQILTDNWLKVCIQPQMPLLKVETTQLPDKVILALAEIFGINPKDIQNDNGILRYSDPTKFLLVPTKIVDQGPENEDGIPTWVEWLDLENIGGPVLSQKEALALVQSALTRANVPISPGLTVTPTVDHTMFEAVFPGKDNPISVPLDTQVNFQFSFNSIPVTGPGAKMKFVFNGNSELTHMTLALPAVSEGASYNTIPQEQADNMALIQYGMNPAKTAGVTTMAMTLPGVPKLTSKLVYWAPADASNLTALLPQYLYGGTVVNPQGGPDIVLRNILIPAYQPQSAEVIPKVQLFVENLRNAINAGTETWGGTPPYTYAWTSSTTDITYMTESSINYKIVPRPNMALPEYETVTVVVTDAAGVKAAATKSVPLIVMAAEATQPAADDMILPVGGVLDVGTEWVGQSQGLGGSSSNATGFVSVLGGAGANARFNWGDNNAWERDFKDPVFAGGDDTNWIDNVDAAFYTGHANGDGFTFPGTVNDGFLHYTDARWGNRDLEWLVIAACGPLQLESGGKHWYQRWGPAFYGLHLLCAYQTSSNDNTIEGRKYAHRLLSGQKVRNAWINTAIEVQPSSVRFGVMGVIQNGNFTNINDHYWGKGYVSPDVPRSKVTGYWLIHGPC